MQLSTARPAPDVIAARVRRIVLLADLAGTGLFAAEGALTAIRGRLDLLGIVVVAFVTALGGGMLRDVLLQAGRPAALGDVRYPVAVVIGVLAALLFGGTLGGSGAGTLLVLDAAGLALFTVSGTEKALSLRTPAYAAILLGAVTATGGGTIRDILLAGVPQILRTGFYATAALGGATILVALRAARISPRAASLVGCLACFLLRMLGAELHWQLPTFG